MTELGGLTLAELVELRDRVARELTRRFEHRLCLVFTDVVGSTAYIARHGDVAGRELLHRHHRILTKVIDEVGGRVVDTAGDGAFCTTGSAHDGAVALVRFQTAVLEDNAEIETDHRLRVRSALHWAPVLVDGDHVTGEAVHATARLCEAAGAGEIRVSEAAFRALPISLRGLCRPVADVDARGLDAPIATYRLDWRNPKRMPTAVEVLETGARHEIPLSDPVTVGRLATFDDRPANDIVVDLPDPGLAKRISRWHVELELTPDGYLLRRVGRGMIEVDGEPLAQGASALIRPGSEARLAKVATLRFSAPELDVGTTTIATLLGETLDQSEDGGTR
jgi:class 3 adenylate cyclase